MSREEKRAWWHGEVERWRASGLSQSAYCRERGLRLAQFSYWKRRFAEAPESCPGEAALVPVSLLEGPGEAAADAGVVVELAHGVRLHLARGFDATVLAAAVAALRQR